MLFHTVTNASVLHTVGKMINGFTEVASDTDLNAVSAIHTKGTSIMKEKKINII
jgi:hypothetical protein